MRPYHPSSRLARGPHRNQAALLRLLGASLFASVLGTSMLASDAARAQSRGPVAEFDGGIGVIPATWAGVSPTNPVAGAIANNVNDTPPAGRPWGISDVKAKVFGDGSFDIRGEGLIFTGGGNIGRSGNVSVRARLYCGPNGTLGKFTSEETVQLAPNGDFRLRGQFPLLNPPLECPNAVLLILNAGQSAANAGGWFAAGIPKD